jgi:hypothetical protein
MGQGMGKAHPSLMAHQARQGLGPHFAPDRDLLHSQTAHLLHHTTAQRDYVARILPRTAPQPRAHQITFFSAWSRQTAYAGRRASACSAWKVPRRVEQGGGGRRPGRVKGAGAPAGRRSQIRTHALTGCFCRRRAAAGG